MASCLLESAAMSTRRYLVARLRDLCEREGGYAAVADQAGLNDQTLYQIAKEVPLPSGKPRSIGPNVSDALDIAFPGWSGLEQHVVRQSRATYHIGERSLESLLHELAHALAGIPLDRRAALGEMLAGLAREGGATHWVEAAIAIGSKKQ